MIRARGNPAGRKPLREKASGLRDSHRRVALLLQTQRPNDRTADDPTGNAASKNDGCHDASTIEKRRHHGPLRERDRPRRVEKKVEPDLNLGS